MRHHTYLLTVVIPTRNKAGLVRECLDALARSSADMEAILADNGSTDDTPAVAREYEGRFARFRYRRSARNLAYAVVNNRAAADATGEVLLFLNNDVIVSPRAPELLARAVAESGGGIAAPKLLFPGTATIQHAGIRQMLWGYVSNLGTGAPSDEPALNRGGDVFAVTGAMLAIGRRLFFEVGGFNERYRWGYEDVDLCLKARQKGAAVRYVPEVESVHAESATLGSSRRAEDLRWNYGLYRRRWNHVLVPNERATLDRLRRNRVKRVVVFGTGLAARGLFRILTRNRVTVVGFAEASPSATRYCGRPVVPLEEVRRWRFDRLIVATQRYFALREQLDESDPEGAALFPDADAVST
jgi:GT2 family glycosyltransferase